MECGKYFILVVNPKASFEPSDFGYYFRFRDSCHHLSFFLFCFFCFTYLLFIDKATLNGYVKELTVVSPSRDWKCRLFDFTIQTSDDEQRVACLNREKHKLLSKIYQAEIGCDIKR